MSAELAGLYAEDLRDHASGHRGGTPAYAAMRERDRERRKAVAALIGAGALESGEDRYRAAQIFQHGETAADAWSAHELARAAAESGHRPARWLCAAAYDRWLVMQGKPQKYGTQYVVEAGRHRLWDVDPSTTDEERAAWDVPPLAEQRRKAEEATRRDRAAE